MVDKKQKGITAFVFAFGLLATCCFWGWDYNNYGNKRNSAWEPRSSTTDKYSSYNNRERFKFYNGNNETDKVIEIAFNADKTSGIIKVSEENPDNPYTNIKFSKVVEKEYSERVRLLGEMETNECRFKIYISNSRDKDGGRIRLDRNNVEWNDFKVNLKQLNKFYPVIGEGLSKQWKCWILRQIEKIVVA